MKKHYLAGDLGAESGRVVIGTLDDGRLSLEEIHRFPNVPIKGEKSIHWDIERLFKDFKSGLKFAAKRGVAFRSLSIVSWGVDYILFDKQGMMMTPVHHYRDPRSERGVERIFREISWEEIFAESGIQFMPINALFQLATEPAERFDKAGFLLGVGDAFNYMLGGEAVVERSMASTFQIYSPTARTWASRLAQAAGVPLRLLPPIVDSGTLLGHLKDGIQNETGLGPIPLYATCSHDTGAAVVAVPAGECPWAYLSSGTWSLLGVELPSPVLTETCRKFNFTNEIGHEHTVRLLKNIAGLWIVQECKRHWASEGQDFGYDRLTQMAREASDTSALINPADPRFLPPGDMPRRIREFCTETGQHAPVGPGETIRAVLESLALMYRRTLRQADQLAGRASEVLHVVGGGCRNDLLNQLTADATEIEVLAGPVEATAMGNILMQALALKDLPTWSAARQCVARSFELKRFRPGNGPSAEKLQRFERFFEQ